MHFVFNGELLEHLLPQFYRQLGRAQALFSGGGEGETGREGPKKKATRNQVKKPISDTPKFPLSKLLTLNSTITFPSSTNPKQTIRL